TDRSSSIGLDLVGIERGGGRVVDVAVLAGDQLPVAQRAAVDVGEDRQGAECDGHVVQPVPFVRVEAAAAPALHEQDLAGVEGDQVDDGVGAGGADDGV